MLLESERSDSEFSGLLRELSCLILCIPVVGVKSERNKTPETGNQDCFRRFSYGNSICLYCNEMLNFGYRDNRRSYKEDGCNSLPILIKKTDPGITRDRFSKNNS